MNSTRLLFPLNPGALMTAGSPRGQDRWVFCTCAGISPMLFSVILLEMSNEKMWRMSSCVEFTGANWAPVCVTATCVFLFYIPTAPPTAIPLAEASTHNSDGFVASSIECVRSVSGGDVFGRKNWEHLANKKKTVWMWTVKMFGEWKQRPWTLFEG